MHKKVRLLTLAPFLIAFSCCSVMAKSPGCLTYDKETVQLTGRIVIRTFPGPPNYESIKAGDKRDRPWFLRLSRPICMKADSDGDFNEAEARVYDIHLVLYPQQFRKLKTIMKKGPVTLSGTLFHAFNAHHHARVLMRVTGIKGR